jgi:hypothetical protein
MDDYEIGYGKPPKTTQFKKGQSGNRRGRPRGSKNHKTILLKELLEPITLNINGKPTKMPTFQAMIKRLKARALNEGDIKSISYLLKEFATLEAAEEPREKKFPLNDQAIIDAYVANLARPEENNND